MVTIIAEAGVNHNGQLDLALRLVDAAADAGADIVKFQTFRANALASIKAPKAAYQIETTGAAETQFEMLKKLELDLSAHQTLIAHCRLRRIGFLSTPFDLGSLEMLIRDLCVDRIKVGSGDLNNMPLLLAIARTGRDIILSTGMATLPEVVEALGVIAFGYNNVATPPSRTAFQTAWSEIENRKILKKKIVIMHCTTAYPTPPININLLAMDTLAEELELPVGFSDHSDDISIPIAAAARGAVMIEKHLTLDRTMVGPDHRASIEPIQFAAMVRGIRDASLALGHGRKEPTEIEFCNKTVARKSLVAAQSIRQGEIFTRENLTVKRPGTGMSPMCYWEQLGRPASRAYEPDELIEEISVLT